MDEKLMMDEIIEAKFSKRIENCIRFVRGKRVLLDRDLATLYDVPFRKLREAVADNPERFPEDFVFSITPEEAYNISQGGGSLFQHFMHSNSFGIHSSSLAFTEHGALMLSTVLQSPLANDVCVQIIRAFVRLRKYRSLQDDTNDRLQYLEEKIASIEQRLMNHKIEENQDPNHLLSEHLLGNGPSSHGQYFNEYLVESLEQKQKYDAFFVYDSCDLEEVTEIANALKEFSIQVWLDQWEVSAGESLELARDKAAGKARCVALFLGRSGSEAWEKPRIRSSLRNCARRIPIFPVILKCARGRLILPVYLHDMKVVDFRMPEHDPIMQLKDAIVKNKGG